MAHVAEFIQKTIQKGDGFNNWHREVVAEIQDCNIIKLELVHNGICGGDSGHGGFVSIKITDLGGTDMSVNGEMLRGFEIKLGGDSERETFSKAFEIIANELNSHK